MVGKQVADTPQVPIVIPGLEIFGNGQLRERGSSNRSPEFCARDVVFEASSVDPPHAESRTQYLGVGGTKQHQTSRVICFQRLRAALAKGNVAIDVILDDGQIVLA